MYEENVLMLIPLIRALATFPVNMDNYLQIEHNVNSQIFWFGHYATQIRGIMSA